MVIWLEKVYANNASGLANWYKRYASKVFGVSVFDGGLAYAYLLYLVLNNRIYVADFVLYFGLLQDFLCGLVVFWTNKLPEPNQSCI